MFDRSAAAHAANATASLGGVMASIRSLGFVTPGSEVVLWTDWVVITSARRRHEGPQARLCLGVRNLHREV